MASSDRTDPRAVVAAATRHYLRGEPVDMSALASELGTSRATLYRRVGNHEQLLGTVLADMTERTFRSAARNVPGEGSARILATLDRFMRAVLDAAPLKALTVRSPVLFIRIATAPGPVEQRSTQLITELLQEEVDQGNLTMSLPTDVIAQAIVRIADSFMYAHLLGGREPAIDVALDVIALLLQEGPGEVS